MALESKTAEYNFLCPRVRVAPLSYGWSRNRTHSARKSSPTILGVYMYYLESNMD